jgi:hypothetical protein
VSDCAATLTCVLRSNAGGGVCDIADYGLSPTGKACVGECAAAEDCCELPPTGVSFVHPTSGITSVARSCADIVAALGGALTVCTPALAATSLLNPLCFYHATYCNSHSECGSGTARVFCVTPSTATVPTYRSAMTD